MPHLRRLLWLLAWIVWAWLGYGLYRELPRDPVSVESTWEFGANQRFLCWLPGEPTAITIEDGDADSPSMVRSWDALTGRLKSEFSGPGDVIDRPDCYCLPRHGLLLCDARPELPGKPASQNWSVLDLKTGAWLDLPCKKGDGGGVVFAPTKPLAVFHHDQRRRLPRRSGESTDRYEQDWLVLVVDLTTGRIALRLTNGVGGQPFRDLFSPPIFAGDDAIVLETRVPSSGFDAKSNLRNRVEYWRFDSPATPSSVWLGMRMREDPVASRTGRVAWHRIGTRPEEIDVVDLATGKTLLHVPPPGERQPPEMKDGMIVVHSYYPAPVLSLDGRTIQLPSENAVRDVDTGTVLWKEREGERAGTADPLGTLEIAEEWPPLFNGWPRNLKTYALRDLRTMRLLQRTWVSTAAQVGRPPSTDTWLLDDNRNVCRLPATANYPLLLLSQSILALPLILLWALLRWCRKRRLRLASATQ